MAKDTAAYSPSRWWFGGAPTVAPRRTEHERETAARRIIVQRLEEGEQRIGGIIIPDTAKEKPQRGRVIAADNGKAKDDGKLVPLDVKAGDRILFGKYAGQEIKLDGEEYLIMKYRGTTDHNPL